MAHIALFGGSFNPPHLGHREVAQWLCLKKEFDQVWVLPSYSHPFAKQLISFEQRLEMCHLNFDGLDKKIAICDIEGVLKNTPSYMIDTVNALKEKHSKYNFSLVVGSDLKGEMPKWKNWAELRNKIKLFSIPRAGFEEAPFMNISSSKIRELIKVKGKWNQFVTNDVENYILKNHLYTNN